VQISDRKGHIAHQLQLVSEYESDCAFVWYQNIRSALSGLSQSTRVRDKRTDRITTPKTALAVLRRAVKTSPMYLLCHVFL